MHAKYSITRGFKQTISAVWWSEFLAAAPEGSIPSTARFSEQ
jgi:hypothetical protein